MRTEPLNAGRTDTGARFATYRRIAESLRNQILKGEVAPGQRLPSKGDLMEVWHASSFTVHSALQTLIKEGWIESIRGSGTYVSHAQNRFVTAGIYHGNEICSEKMTPFARQVHLSLLEKLHEAGKQTQVFLDTRPECEQNTLLPSLVDAVFHRRIQCLIFPFANKINLPELSRLKMPTATLSLPAPTVINYDLAQMFRDGAQRLAAAGGRSVGLLSTYRSDNGYMDPFYAQFRNGAHGAGLQVIDSWISNPTEWVRPEDIERRSYAEFKRFWNSPEKPDSMIIFPDMAVRGVITAALEIGMTEVTRQMKFLFHRNAHADILCPFPALWAISDEDAMAAELVAQILKQFEGLRTSSVLVPYSFAENFVR